MAQNQRYNGLPLEDPLDHLDQFERLCRTVKMNGVPEDAIKMILFPFSLGNKAAQWEKNIPSELVSTWDSVKKEFITKFYPKQKTAKLRNDITSFKQGSHENLHEAWDRLKEYTRKCPHHGVSKENLLGIFYRGALEHYRRALDTASYGCFSNLTCEQGEQLVENMAQSEACYGGDYDRTVRDQSPEDERYRELTDKIDKLSKVFLMNQRAVNFVGEADGDQRGYTEGAYDGAQGVQEEVNYLGNQNSFQGGYQNRPYNQGYRNNNLSYRSNNVENPQDQYYPPKAPQGNQFQARPFGGPNQFQNLPWRSQGGVQNSAPAGGYQGDSKYRPPGPLRQNVYPQAQNSDQDEMKNMMKQLLEGQNRVQQELTERMDKVERKIDANHGEAQAKFENIYSHLKTLDNQIAQVASTSKRPAGTFPGKPDTNPKEYVNAIEIKSIGHPLYINSSDDYSSSSEDDSDDEIESDPSEDAPDEENAAGEDSAGTAAGGSVGKPEMLDRHKVLLNSLVTKIRFDIPLLDIFLKKEGFPESIKGVLREKKLALLKAGLTSEKPKNNRPTKTLREQRKDPGKITLPCQIEGMFFPRCLCDLGAGINLMPLSVAYRLGFLRFSKSDSFVVLADESAKSPVGRLKRVSVKIRGYTILTDFVIMDIRQEKRDPIILGRPFLATCRALIDVEGRSIKLRMRNETLEFDIRDMERDPEPGNEVDALAECGLLGVHRDGDPGLLSSNEDHDKPPGNKSFRTYQEGSRGTLKMRRFIQGQEKTEDGEKAHESLHFPPPI